MKILIDTNILIHLEDNKIIEKDFSLFYKLAISNGCKILFHPNAIPIDIKRDKDNERKNIILSKLEKYEKLDNFAIPSDDFLSKINNEKINDIIDNRQLFQLHRNYVDYFITQDKGIHGKSKIFDLNDRVLEVHQALALLEEQYTIKIPAHPILREHSLREIENFFDTIFFDGLKNDYGDIAFNNWLKKCMSENRKCYSLIVENELKALLIYNLENVENHKIPDVFDKALKICTLKVSFDAFGIKLGELFLNKMFEYCINQHVKYLYLTVYDKQIQLISLLEKFGFNRQEFINKQKRKEIRMIKCLDKDKVIAESNTILIHPFYYDKATINKYVIPIRPKFYGTLFKDGKLRQATLFDSAPDSVNEIQGNTILKAYISNTRITKLTPGDILFFYSSKTNMVIEPVGILESAQRVKNFEDLWNIVQKKTVFSQQTLNSMLQEKGELHVIIFRLITYLDRKIKLPRIQQVDSFKNKLQTVTKLKEEDYLELKDEGYFNKRYIID